MKLYPDSQAEAIYGQTPPLVNVTRPPGEWQTYDLFFTAPVFADGSHWYSAATAARCASATSGFAR